MKTEQELLDLVEKYNWTHISIYQELSEPFMEKHYNDLYKVLCGV